MASLGLRDLDLPPKEETVVEREGERVVRPSGDPGDLCGRRRPSRSWGRSRGEEGTPTSTHSSPGVHGRDSGRPGEGVLDHGHYWDNPTYYRWYYRPRGRDTGRGWDVDLLEERSSSFHQGGLGGYSPRPVWDLHSSTVAAVSTGHHYGVERLVGTEEWTELNLPFRPQTTDPKMTMYTYTSL